MLIRVKWHTFTLSTNLHLKLQTRLFAAFNTIINWNMIETPNAIFEFFEASFTSLSPALRFKQKTSKVIELAGTKPTMQGKQQVDGYYFASAMLKSQDCRFYFFPIYTHPTEFLDLSDDLKKLLKGKSCFHLKKLSPALQEEIKNMLINGVHLYQQAKLI
jgi:hypothetical protein